MGRYYLWSPSILGPLLFKIFLRDLFHEYQNNYFADYADDTTPYIFGDNTTEVLTNLSSLAQKLFTWFVNNEIKANHDKCHLFLSTQESFNIQIANFTIKSSKAKNLRGINLDKNFKFDIHVESICQKANRKLNALARIANYMELPKRRILMNAFFKPQFKYCSAIWMFHSRTLNNRNNRLHGHCLRIIYNDKLLNFEEPLHKDDSVSIHHNNKHELAIEILLMVRLQK